MATRKRSKSAKKNSKNSYKKIKKSENKEKKRNVKSMKNKEIKRKQETNQFFVVKKEKKNYWLIIITITFLFISAFLGWFTSTNRYAKFPSKITNETQIVVFYQPGCPHCIAEFPTINKLSKNFSISAINIIQNKSYIRKYNISSTPTLLLINKGKSEILVGEHTYSRIIEAYEKLGKGIFIDYQFNQTGCSVTKNTCTG